MNIQTMIDFANGSIMYLELLNKFSIYLFINFSFSTMIIINFQIKIIDTFFTNIHKHHFIICKMYYSKLEFSSYAKSNNYE